MPKIFPDAVAFRKVDSCREIPIAPGTGSWFEGLLSPTIASAVHSVLVKFLLVRDPAGIDNKPKPRPSRHILPSKPGVRLARRHFLSP